jgi:hypothetical protein
MTKRVKSAAAASRLKSPDCPSPEHVGDDGHTHQWGEERISQIID